MRIIQFLRFGILCICTPGILSLVSCGSETLSPVPEVEISSESSAQLIQKIRAGYTEAMQIKKSTHTFICDDDPLSGQLSLRRIDNKIIWIKYTAGHEHSSLSYEALLIKENIVFIMKSETSWQFDQNVPENTLDAAGNEATLEIEKQERYYFKEGKIIKSLYKMARARSINNEKLGRKLAATPNKSHPRPEASGAMQSVQNILRAQRLGKIKANWCGSGI